MNLTYEAFEFEEQMLVPDDCWVTVRRHIWLDSRVLLLVANSNLNDDIHSPVYIYRTNSLLNFNFRG